MGTFHTGGAWVHAGNYKIKILGALINTAMHEACCVASFSKSHFTGMARALKFLKKLLFLQKSAASNILVIAMIICIYTGIYTQPVTQGIKQLL